MIHFIDRENKGVAKTRNEAIILTETEYLTFLDQDDYLDQEFVQKLYQEAKTFESRCCGGGYRRPDEVGSVRKTVQPSDTEFANLLLWPHGQNYIGQNSHRVYYLDDY